MILNTNILTKMMTVNGKMDMAENLGDISY